MNWNQSQVSWDMSRNAILSRHTVVLEAWRGMLLSFEGCTDVPCLGQHLVLTEKTPGETDL